MNSLGRHLKVIIISFHESGVTVGLVWPKQGWNTTCRCGGFHLVLDFSSWVIIIFMLWGVLFSNLACLAWIKSSYAMVYVNHIFGKGSEFVKLSKSWLGSWCSCPDVPAEWLVDFGLDGDCTACMLTIVCGFIDDTWSKLVLYAGIFSWLNLKDCLPFA